MARVDVAGEGATVGAGVRLRVASTTPPATRARTTTATTAWKPRERRAAVPQVCSLPIDGPHQWLPGGSGGATLSAGLSEEAAGTGRRCGRRRRRDLRG